MTDFKALAARLRDPEQYVDACDEAADLIERFEREGQAERYAPCPLMVGDRVIKENGDSTFEGHVACVFNKQSGYTSELIPIFSGPLRFVVQDDRGILHIFSRQNLRKLP